MQLHETPPILARFTAMKHFPDGFDLAGALLIGFRTSTTPAYTSLAREECQIRMRVSAGAFQTPPGAELRPRWMSDDPQTRRREVFPGSWSAYNT
jgi:hypothetical protein